MEYEGIPNLPPHGINQEDEIKYPTQEKKVDSFVDSSRSSTESVSHQLFKEIELPEPEPLTSSKVQVILRQAGNLLSRLVDKIVAKVKSLFRKEVPLEFIEEKTLSLQEIILLPDSEKVRLLVKGLEQNFTELNRKLQDLLAKEGDISSEVEKLLGRVTNALKQAHRLSVGENANGIRLNHERTLAKLIDQFKTLETQLKSKKSDSLQNPTSNESGKVKESKEEILLDFSNEDYGSTSNNVEQTSTPIPQDPEALSYCFKKLDELTTKDNHKLIRTKDGLVVQPKKGHGISGRSEGTKAAFQYIIDTARLQAEKHPLESLSLLLKLKDTQWAEDIRKPLSDERTSFRETRKGILKQIAKVYPSDDGDIGQLFIDFHKLGIQFKPENEGQEKLKEVSKLNEEEKKLKEISEFNEKAEQLKAKLGGLIRENENNSAKEDSEVALASFKNIVNEILNLTMVCPVEETCLANLTLVRDSLSDLSAARESNLKKFKDENLRNLAFSSKAFCEMAMVPLKRESINQLFKATDAKFNDLAKNWPPFVHIIGLIFQKLDGTSINNQNRKELATYLSGKLPRNKGAEELEKLNSTTGIAAYRNKFLQDLKPNGTSTPDVQLAQAISRNTAALDDTGKAIANLYLAFLKSIASHNEFKEEIEELDKILKDPLKKFSTESQLNHLNHLDWIEINNQMNSILRKYISSTEVGVTCLKQLINDLSAMSEGLKKSEEIINQVERKLQSMGKDLNTLKKALETETDEAKRQELANQIFIKNTEFGALNTQLKAWIDAAPQLPEKLPVLQQLLQNTIKQLESGSQPSTLDSDTWQNLNSQINNILQLYSKIPQF